MCCLDLETALYPTDWGDRHWVPDLVLVRVLLPGVY